MVQHHAEVMTHSGSVAVESAFHEDQRTVAEVAPFGVLVLLHEENHCPPVAVVAAAAREN